MDKEFYLTNHNGEKTRWSPNRIKETILNETDLNEDKAEKIKTRTTIISLKSRCIISSISYF